MKITRQWAGAIGWLVLAGCATSGPAIPLTGNPLVDAPVMVQQGPPRDRVLWQYRWAAAALCAGQPEPATQALDDTLARIGQIYSADAASRGARSYFKEESKKTFLGEPYERVMANYYRGLLYWRDGELDNARASFRNGQFQDADAENKEFAADYVLLDYLDALASAKLGGDGGDAWKRARANCKLAVPPDPNPRANVLFFLEFGQGPTKYATGEYGEQLRFRPGTSLAKEVKVTLDSGAAAHVGPYDDLNFQATTRGGRVMDHVLANKAVFKSATDTVGNAALISGAVLAATAGHNSSADEVGAGLIVAGVLSKLVSAVTTPRADTRGWDNLPLYLSFAALQAPPGPQTATIDFLDANRQPIAALTKTVTFEVPADGRDTVIFVSDRSSTPQHQ